MARMMRNNSWIKVTGTYGTDYTGDFRSRSKKQARAEIDEFFEEIEQEHEQRNSVTQDPHTPE